MDLLLLLLLVLKPVKGRKKCNVRKTYKILLFKVNVEGSEEAYGKKEQSATEALHNLIKSEKLIKKKKWNVDFNIFVTRIIKLQKRDFYYIVKLFE